MESQPRTRGRSWHSPVDSSLAVHELFLLGEGARILKGTSNPKKSQIFCPSGEEFSQPRKHVLTCIRDSHAGKSMQKWQCIRGGWDGLARAQADLKCLYVFLPISAVMFPRGMHTQTPYTIVITFLVLTSGFSSLFLICGWHGRIEGGWLKDPVLYFQRNLPLQTDICHHHPLSGPRVLSFRRHFKTPPLLSAYMYWRVSHFMFINHQSSKAFCKKNKKKQPSFFFLLSLSLSFPLLPFYFSLSLSLPPPPPASGISPTKDWLSDSWEWTEVNQMTNFLSLNIQFF